ncbi:MAG: UDP-3-O-(3-hydroxymyristoyl)glucosamine N-acyltransferase [Candidatus Omnitrophica bacterium CG11_big_fil_rev_8_21_14_0_20_42_13]|uniref:UDP-3-O-acylglucosamine N-acyltransferase n=1 Tax=Candidatus Ghiorseimicrobium undicola TaxID=1974746 RepID=A0A2H0LZJ9_9BACT|nr:MAG: UDP-3-O-(3-hydroxymyristoyl)glucosamine N-acyltransferase [Candidatus Omnitrophica bacterium CG11_big_fil_rev_8_21_14_0_20_42_13]
MPKFEKTLSEIAKIIDGEVVGDGSIVITGLCGIKEANPGDLTFVANSRYLPLIKHTQASAVITSKDIESASKPIIKTENPSWAFAKMVSFLSPNHALHPAGIHPTAILGKNVKLGKNVAIGPYTVVEDEVSISDDTTIYASCYVGHHCVIGACVLVYPNVSIRERVVIGKNVIIHSGSVIGSDGFGFATVRGIHEKIPQIGTVLIEDNVEIGANVTIDRARFDKTIIGKGTKIDNLVQIAHNVVIGENSIVVSQAGISGSTTIGKGVILAGQAGIVGHITIGDGAVVAAQAGVTKSVPANTKVSGYPAKPHETAKRVNACLQRLPELHKTINLLKEKIKELEEKLNDRKAADH